MNQIDIKEFSLETVLSITCNTILTADMNSICNCVNYITNSNLYPPTPQLQLYTQIHILTTFPKLLGVVPTNPITDAVSAYTFIQEQLKKHPKMIPLSPMPNGIIEQVGPIKKIGCYKPTSSSIIYRTTI